MKRWVACLFAVVAIAAMAEEPKTATIIPAPKMCKVYPCVEIKDAPRFKWRGMLIDTARHFLGKTAILRVIEEMSWYKFNVLHIHFTDDPFRNAGRGASLDKVYRFDVLEGVVPGARKNVAGGECCNWSEWTLGIVDLEWRLWPRLCSAAHKHAEIWYTIAQEERRWERE